MKTAWAFIGLVGLLVACSALTLNDPHTILDPPNHTLRGKTPKDDRPESDCDPVKQYACDPKLDSHCDLAVIPPCDPVSDTLCTMTLKYLCVVHKLPDYKALLKYVDRLEKDLKSCQQGRQ